MKSKSTVGISSALFFGRVDNTSGTKHHPTRKQLKSNKNVIQVLKVRIELPFFKLALPYSSALTLNAKSFDLTSFETLQIISNFEPKLS